MKICICTFFSIILIGCASPVEAPKPPEPLPQNSGADASAPDWSNYDHQADDSKDPGMCERYEHVVLQDADGGVVRDILVPLPCDPLWWMKEHGDPPMAGR